MFINELPGCGLLSWLPPSMALTLNLSCGFSFSWIVLHAGPEHCSSPQEQAVVLSPILSTARSTAVAAAVTAASLSPDTIVISSDVCMTFLHPRSYRLSISIAETRSPSTISSLSAGWRPPSSSAPGIGSSSTFELQDSTPELDRLSILSLQSLSIAHSRSTITGPSILSFSMSYTPWFRSRTSFSRWRNCIRSCCRSPALPPPLDLCWSLPQSIIMRSRPPIVPDRCSRWSWTISLGEDRSRTSLRLASHSLSRCRATKLAAQFKVKLVRSVPGDALLWSKFSIRKGEVMALCCRFFSIAADEGNISRLLSSLIVTIVVLGQFSVEEKIETTFGLDTDQRGATILFFIFYATDFLFMSLKRYWISLFWVLTDWQVIATSSCLRFA